MTPPGTPLGEELLARLRARGPMTFRDFMAEALYHPRHGYYTTGRPWEGPGDFTTAPAHGEVFAGSIAVFLGWVRQALGPGRFEVVEVGSGSGLLAAQLQPLLRDQGLGLRSVEHRRPPRLPRDVPWSASLEGLEVRGAIVANELFDALPCHRVVRTAGGLREMWVVARGDALDWEPGPVSRPEVAALAARHGLAAAEGEAAEVCPEAGAMVRRMARALDAGVVLAFDYGDDAPGLAHRPGGTLAATREHRLAPDPLADPGRQDLTAHVNFTALREAAAAAGLEVVAEVPQWRFLAAAGAVEGVAARLQGPGFAAALAAKALLVPGPGGMGEFRAVVLGKGLPPGAAERLARRLALP